MVNFITSMNEALFHQYGKRALDEFDSYAGDNVKLLVMYEGEIPDYIPKYKRVAFKKLNGTQRSLFLERFSHLKEANGLRVNFEKNDRGEMLAKFYWDFRYNAVRFSHKIFSISESLQHLNDCNHLVWIDADIRILRAFDENDLEDFLPEQTEIMAYLGRNEFPKPNPYSEGGWYAFNTNHDQFKNFINDITEYYPSGDIFKLTEWHDCWVVDTVRALYEQKGFVFKNISGPAINVEHPFVNCGLGKIFDHLKGPARKQNGRSFEKDYQQKGRI
jgi:hypothetical protein